MTAPSQGPPSQGPGSQGPASTDPRPPGPTQPARQLPQTDPLPPQRTQQSAGPPSPAWRHQPWGGAGWRPTNTKAVLSLALLTFPVASIIFGALARAEIKRTGEAGWGLATAGLIAGIVIVSGYLLFIVIYLGFILSVLGLSFVRTPTFGL